LLELTDTAVFCGIIVAPVKVSVCVPFTAVTPGVGPAFSVLTLIVKTTSTAGGHSANIVVISVIFTTNVKVAFFVPAAAIFVRINPVLVVGAVSKVKIDFLVVFLFVVFFFDIDPRIELTGATVLCGIIVTETLVAVFVPCTAISVVVDPVIVALARLEICTGAASSVSASLIVVGVEFTTFKEVAVFVIVTTETVNINPPIFVSAVTIGVFWSGVPVVFIVFEIFKVIEFEVIK